MSAAETPELTPGEGSRSMLFAAGERGQRLFIPAGVTLVDSGNPIVETSATLESVQRARIAEALSAPVDGKSLKEIAAGKRRVAILVGNLSRPARYDIALPALVAALVEAGIRPSRIAFLACPGGCGPLLGRSAIHRYGEEICGDHDAIAWPADGAPGELYDAADLRIAVASCPDGADFHAFLPRNAAVDFSLELSSSRTLQIEIESAKLFSGTGPARESKRVSKSASAADVLFVSGGGSPWEETLEEALFSLYAPRATASTAVLIFSGSEGLGASRFSRDTWTLIEQAEEVLAAGKSLGAPSASGPFDPVIVLAECLKRYKQTILFSQNFLEHSEGDDLIDRLAAAPNVGARLGVCGSHAGLWKILEAAHGAHYSICAEPLGWRG